MVSDCLRSIKWSHLSFHVLGLLNLSNQTNSLEIYRCKFYIIIGKCVFKKRTTGRYF